MKGCFNAGTASKRSAAFEVGLEHVNSTNKVAGRSSEDPSMLPFVPPKRPHLLSETNMSPHCATSNWQATSVSNGNSALAEERHHQATTASQAGVQPQGQAGSVAPTRPVLIVCLLWCLHFAWHMVSATPVLTRATTLRLSYMSVNYPAAVYSCS